MSMPFDLPGYLAAGKERVEALLASRMDALADRVPARLFEAMRYSLVDGGKRLRPILCLAFAEAFGGRADVAAEDAACAVELVHTYSLIHDDLPAMDDDDLRRGRPTSHKVFGEAMAILAGDALLTEAMALVVGRETSALRARLCAELAAGAGAAGMVGGQVLDIAEDRPAEEAYLVPLHRLKTGALIRAACRMGALAGGAEPGGPALAAVDAYGDAVGLAFQIADDLLDVTATAEQLGKPSGADAAAGRHTFPAVLGLDGARRRAGECIERALAAARTFEPSPGPLAALARYAVERKQ